MNGIKGKNNWALFLLILSGIVIGGFIGYYLGQVPAMSWLNYGKDFGLEKPLILDLEILYISFGINIKITISSILGILAAILIYRKL